MTDEAQGGANLIADLYAEICDLKKLLGLLCEARKAAMRELCLCHQIVDHEELAILRQAVTLHRPEESLEITLRKWHDPHNKTTKTETA